ncbi:hypothetical protein ACVWWG_007752 [Bradyrhizobium sp. LB7.2]
MAKAGRNPLGLYLYLESVDAAAREFQQSLEDKPWGMYEFAMSDPDEALVRRLANASPGRSSIAVRSWPRLGPPHRSDQCLLLRDKLMVRELVATSRFDPERTFAAI